MQGVLTKNGLISCSKTFQSEIWGFFKTPHLFCSNGVFHKPFLAMFYINVAYYVGPIPLNTRDVISGFPSGGQKHFRPNLFCGKAKKNFFAPKFFFAPKTNKKPAFSRSSYLMLNHPSMISVSSKKVIFTRNLG